MAAEFTTPVCEVTGLPLPILPPEPRESGALSISRSPDFHHAWHPRRDVLAIKSGGLALRRSRVQTTSWEVHHNGYHDMFIGPELPNSTDELFRLTVLSAAGVVPRRAIDLSRKWDYKIVDLDDDQHAMILNKVKIERRKPISRFFAEYALEQNVTDVITDSQINEFLDRRTDGGKKREIASILLAGALEISVDNLGLTNSHRELRDQGLLVENKPKTLKRVAKRIVRLGHLEYFSNEMQIRLADS